MSKTLALDFDGPVHSYVSGWTGDVPTDPPTEGALEFVLEKLKGGWEVVIFTTRAKTPEGLTGTQDWLVHFGFPKMKITHEKIPALVYVDDRAVKFDPWAPNWDEVNGNIDLIVNRPKRTSDEVKAKRTYPQD